MISNAVLKEIRNERSLKDRKNPLFKAACSDINFSMKMYTLYYEELLADLSLKHLLDVCECSKNLEVIKAMVKEFCTSTLADVCHKIIDDIDIVKIFADRFNQRELKQMLYVACKKGNIKVFNYLLTCIHSPFTSEEIMRLYSKFTFSASVESSEKKDFLESLEKKFCPDVSALSICKDFDIYKLLTKYVDYNNYTDVLMLVMACVAHVDTNIKDFVVNLLIENKTDAVMYVVLNSTTFIDTVSLIQLVKGGFKINSAILKKACRRFSNEKLVNELVYEMVKSGIRLDDVSVEDYEEYFRAMRMYSEECIAETPHCEDIKKIIISYC